MATKASNKPKKVVVTPNASSVDDYERELEVFKNDGGRWGWRTRAGKNHKIVSTAGEDFSRKGDAVKAASREQGFYKPGVAVVIIWED